MWRDLPAPRTDEPDVARAGCERCASTSSRCARKSSRGSSTSRRADRHGVATVPDLEERAVRDAPPVVRSDGSCRSRANPCSTRRTWSSRSGTIRSVRGKRSSSKTRPAIPIWSFRPENEPATKRRSPGSAASFPTCSTRRRAAGTISGPARTRAAISVRASTT